MYYTKDKKAYNKILALHNSIDFLMNDFEATDDEFDEILLGLESFINYICIAENNRK